MASFDLTIKCDTAEELLGHAQRLAGHDEEAPTRLPADQVRGAEQALVTEAATGGTRKRRTKAEIEADAKAAAETTKGTPAIDPLLAEPTVVANAGEPDLASLLGESSTAGEPDLASLLGDEPTGDKYAGWTHQQALDEIKKSRVAEHGIPWLRDSVLKPAFEKDKTKDSLPKLTVDELTAALRHSDGLRAVAAG